MSKSKKSADEVLVCVHTVDSEDAARPPIHLPDARSNKPIGIHDKKEGQIAFFQRLINTNIGDEKASVAIPNEIALSLSISAKSRRRADSLRREIKAAFKKSDGALYNQDVKSAYDFLEEIQKAVVFSYKAVESFCNAIIPDKHVYKKANSKGVVEHYGKEQIERWITTSEKVSVIVPAVLSCRSPNEEEFWVDFKNLERIRNEIIHSKSSNGAELLQELFSPAVECYCTSSVQLLAYFIEKDPMNEIFPLGFGASHLKVMSVDDAGDLFIEKL